MSANYLELNIEGEGCNVGEGELLHTRRSLGRSCHSRLMEQAFRLWLQVLGFWVDKEVVRRYSKIIVKSRRVELVIIREDLMGGRRIYLSPICDSLAGWGLFAWNYRHSDWFVGEGGDNDTSHDYPFNHSSAS